MIKILTYSTLHSWKGVVSAQKLAKHTWTVNKGSDEVMLKMINMPQSTPIGTYDKQWSFKFFGETQDQA